MRTIRASEIGTYLYCQRAWWYRKQGVPSDNVFELTEGRAIHARHGRTVFLIKVLRILAYGLLLAAAVLMITYLANELF
jgi:CRISPR/Cas system-associated exonuclease Cas4 (RecB family)